MQDSFYFKDYFEEFDLEFSMLNEEVATWDEIEDKEAMYQSYYQAYAEKGLKPWTQDEYEWRAHKWTFAGVLPRQGIEPARVGFVTARNKNGVLKLTGMQGTNAKAKVKGMIELSKTGLPIWGAMDKDFTVRLQKLGFSSPPASAMRLFFPIIQQDPQFSSGGSWDKINADGSISFDLQGVGQTTKYFVGNKQFYRMLIDKLMAKQGIDPQMKAMVVKWNSLPDMAKQMAAPMLAKKGIDMATMDWLAEVMSDDTKTTTGGPKFQPQTQAQPKSDIMPSLMGLSKSFLGGQ